MRILGNRPVKTGGKSSRADRSAGAGAVFSLADGEADASVGASSNIAGAAPIVGISSLLALQETDPDQQKSKAIRHGHDTLDALDALKIDVLSGQVSKQKLLNLAALVQNEVQKERQGLADHTLMNILDHIELRARVELAKQEQASHYTHRPGY